MNFKKGDVIKIDMGLGKGVESVTLMNDFSSKSGVQFVTLKRSSGAPYTITTSRLQKILIKENMKPIQKLERIVETIVERKLNESSGVDVFMVKKTRYGLNDPVTYQVFTDNRSSPNATCEVSIEKVKQFELELFGGLNNAAVRLFDKYK